MEHDTPTRIGPDEIVPSDKGLIILSTSDMDWWIREFCRVPIWFQEHKYYPHDKRFETDRQRFAHDLRHWPEDHPQASSDEIIYNEHYVEERDRNTVDGKMKERWRRFLLPFYPLLGMLWSDYKNRVLVPIGFRPDSITRLSVFVSFNVAYITGIFVGWLGYRHSALLWGIMTIFGMDCLIRFSQSLNFDIQHHWGFLEWLWPRKKEDPQDESGSSI